MKVLKILFLLLFLNSSCFAQQWSHYQAFFLIISGLKQNPNYTRIDLFVENDSAIVEIWTEPFPEYIDYMSFERPKADTSYFVSIEKFDKVYELFMALSIEQLINGMNLQKQDLTWDEPTKFRLKIKVISEYIILDVVEPSFNTQERNLEPFLDICKEIICLAKLNSKNFFGK